MPVMAHNSYSGLGTNTTLQSACMCMSETLPQVQETVQEAQRKKLTFVLCCLEKKQ